MTILDGPDVYLRATNPADSDALHELWNDPEGHLLSADDPFVPVSPEWARTRLEQKAKTEPDRVGDVWLAAVSRADDTVLGTAGLWGFVPFIGVAHAGMRLRSPVRSAGYGSQILPLLCRYGFRMRALRRIELETFATNVAMRKVAERSGFVHEGTLRGRGYDGDGFVDVVTYGLLREEWSGRSTVDDAVRSD
jgi:RimJ/RimL family protein N-acetyltransferase